MQAALVFAFMIVLPSIFFITNAQVDDANSPVSSADTEEQIYIVYLSEKPPKGQDPEDHYTKILSSVVGSEKAAKDALVYSYGIIPGFAARLNPDQATRLDEQAGVSYVIKDIKYELDHGNRINA
ncbi:Cucumisin [Handroanthus impetiginosus]|uniref:Cucumisin n=1 Tax=Handroanthus impetiginosus TaxID=429701 RepID=A0A2G9I0Q1_9LAMI|nr:Cucumisin [Handroanthus impetiginosus]